MAEKNTQLERVHHQTESVLEQWPEYFLVDLKILQSNQIKVFIDADQGASIDELARINRALRKRIDELDLFEAGNYALEVSSPGLEEPLRQLRQYRKNRGREVEVLLKDGRKKKGILQEVADDHIVLTYPIKAKKGSKKPQKEQPEKAPEQFAFNDIKNTKVCVGF